METLGVVCQLTIPTNDMLIQIQTFLMIKPDTEPIDGVKMVSLEYAIAMVVPTLLSRSGTNKSKSLSLLNTIPPNFL